MATYDSTTGHRLSPHAHDFVPKLDLVEIKNYESLARMAIEYALSNRERIWFMIVEMRVYVGDES